MKGLGHYGFIACPASKLRHTCSDHCCRMGNAASRVAARAQQAANLPVIGSSAPSPQRRLHTRRLRPDGGLNEVGFVEGQNVTIEYRRADGQYDRLPAMAADLVRRSINLITPPRLLRPRWQPGPRPRPSQSCSWWASIRYRPDWSRSGQVVTPPA
jgi:hypothetical protein